MDSKEFHIANLSDDKLRELKRVEAELSEKFSFNCMAKKLKD